MKVNIKRLHENAIIPSYSKEGDAGLDLTATSRKFIDGNIVYGTGLSFEIPKGFVGLIFPRSSNSKTDLMLTNHVGVVDSGYRGEVMLKYSEVGKQGQFWCDPETYNVGDRVGQLIIMPYPTIEFEEVEEVEELTETERGANGYGHTGR